MIQVPVNVSQSLLYIIAMESFDDYPTRHQVKTSFSVCPTLCNFTVSKVLKFERRKVVKVQLNALSIITWYRLWNIDHYRSYQFPDSKHKEIFLGSQWFWAYTSSKNNIWKLQRLHMQTRNRNKCIELVASGKIIMFKVYSYFHISRLKFQFPINPYVDIFQMIPLVHSPCYWSHPNQHKCLANAENHQLLRCNLFFHVKFFGCQRQYNHLEWNGLNPISQGYTYINDFTLF